VVGAVMGGSNPRDAIAAAMAMNPQHAIVSGGGAMPADSVGFPWNGRFIVASGNLLADFRSNLHAESQGLMQAVRTYEMTDDPGVKDHLSFMIARDTMHQNQWLAAIEDLQSEGFEEIVVPKIAYEYGKNEYAYQFWNHSEGEDSDQVSIVLWNLCIPQVLKLLPARDVGADNAILPALSPSSKASTIVEKGTQQPM
jgi:Mn-containing catalase